MRKLIAWEWEVNPTPTAAQPQGVQYDRHSFPRKPRIKTPPPLTANEQHMVEMEGALTEAEAVAFVLCKLANSIGSGDTQAVGGLIVIAGDLHDKLYRINRPGEV